MMKITESSIDTAQEEMSKTLYQFSQEFIDYSDKAAESVANTAVDELKMYKYGVGPWKVYPRSFRTKEVGKGSYLHHWKVYSAAPHYRLTHLLEFGHNNAHGRPSRAFPHWAPTEKHAVEAFQKIIMNFKPKL